MSNAENYSLFMMSGVRFISLALSIMALVGMWKMFEKLGENGWKSLIPFYNIYVICKMMNKKLFIPYIISSLAVIVSATAFMFIFVINLVSTTFSSDYLADVGQEIVTTPFLITLFLFLGSCVVNTIIAIIIRVGFVKLFDVGVIAVLGAIFLSRITFFIIGIGNFYPVVNGVIDIDCAEPNESDYL